MDNSISAGISSSILHPQSAPVNIPNSPLSNSLGKHQGSNTLDKDLMIFVSLRIAAQFKTCQYSIEQLQQPIVAPEFVHARGELHARKRRLGSKEPQQFIPHWWVVPASCISLARRLRLDQPWFKVRELELLVHSETTISLSFQIEFWFSNIRNESAQQWSSDA